jgi:uncharacterized membrane protein YphA (DoxX/SURF4 family)
MRKQHLALALVLALVFTVGAQSVWPQTTQQPTSAGSPTPTPTLTEEEIEAQQATVMWTEIGLGAAILVGTALLAYFGLRKQN